jgi:putative addiction module component (TIGR02574 family)
MSQLLEQAMRLSIAERRKLADDIYDSLEATDEGISLTPEQETELTRRLADFEKNPGGNFTWEEIAKEALARK